MLILQVIVTITSVHPVKAFVSQMGKGHTHASVIMDSVVFYVKTVSFPLVTFLKFKSRSHQAQFINVWSPKLE